MNKLSVGISFPIGSTVFHEGVNFCLFSKNSHRVDLLLFDGSMAMHFLDDARSKPLTFELPRLSLNPNHVWKRWVDTNLPSPDDICGWDEAPEVTDFVYTINAYSLAILIMRD